MGNAAFAERRSGRS